LATATDALEENENGKIRETEDVGERSRERGRQAVDVCIDMR
jgi:hypothetical protein